MNDTPGTTLLSHKDQTSSPREQQTEQHAMTTEQSGETNCEGVGSTSSYLYHLPCANGCSVVHIQSPCVALTDYGPTDDHPGEDLDGGNQIQRVEKCLLALNPVCQNESDTLHEVTAQGGLTEEASGGVKLVPLQSRLQTMSSEETQYPCHSDDPLMLNSDPATNCYTGNTVRFKISPTFIGYPSESVTLDHNLPAIASNQAPSNYSSLPSCSREYVISSNSQLPAISFLPYEICSNSFIKHPDDNIKHDPPGNFQCETEPTSSEGLDSAKSTMYGACPSTDQFLKPSTAMAVTPSPFCGITSLQGRELTDEERMHYHFLLKLQILSASIGNNLAKRLIKK